MVVDKYLKELALGNRRVIIPDLGAFLSKEDDNDEKNLIFSSFLKYNDGFLEKQLSEKEKISQTQASEEIKKFVEEVTKALKGKQHYAVDGFGFFHTDERGGIAFTPQGAGTHPKPVEEMPIVTPIAVPVTSSSASASKEKEVEPQQPMEVAATPPKEEQSTAKPPPPSRPEPPKQAPPQEPEERSGNNGLLITIIILLLIIIALLALYFTVPSIKERVNAIFCIRSTTEQVATPPVDQALATDSLSAVGTAKQDTMVTTAATTPTTAATFGSNWHVIVGTFQERVNAERMYKRVVADGYSAEILPKMGPLYPVSIFNSPSREESMRVMREAQRKYGDAWIFRSRRN